MTNAEIITKTAEYLKTRTETLSNKLNEVANDAEKRELQLALTAGLLELKGVFDLIKFLIMKEE